METSSQNEEPGVDPILAKHSVQLSACNGVWELLVPFPSAKLLGYARNRSSLVKLCKRYVGLIVQIRLNTSYLVFWFSLDAQELFSAKLMIN